MRNILFVAIAVAATSALTACGKKETATVGSPEVLVIEAPTQDVPVYREWIGTFDGSQDAEIKAHVTGYLIKRDYQEGSLVKKETCFLRLTPVLLKPRWPGQKASSRVHVRRRPRRKLKLTVAKRLSSNTQCPRRITIIRKG